jgi:hypothetical protein
MTQVQDTPRQDSAAVERLQRQTCKWLCFTTVLLCVAVIVIAFMVPADFYNDVVRLELWHAPITAALLFWGWRGGELPRVLASVAVAAGMLYLAPTVFLVGLLLVVPADNIPGYERLAYGLVYLSALLVYYGVALVFVRRANWLRRA